ncbi:unknown protein [Leptolyngbya sp. NIES-3755]|nr:unknown protein [Leptolyngbya sp. NIES-3755]
MPNSPKLDREKADRYRDYRRKWRSIAQDRQPIDQARAKDAIVQFYAAFGLKQPTIEFYPGVSSAYRAEVRKLAEKNRTPTLLHALKGWLWFLGIFLIAWMSQAAILIYRSISPSLKEWLRQYGLDQLYTALEQTSIEGEDGIRTPLLAVIVFWIILLSVVGIHYFIHSHRSQPSVQQAPIKDRKLRFLESSSAQLIQHLKTQLIEPISQQLSLEVQTAVYRSLVAHSVYEAGFIRDWCDRFWRNQFCSHGKVPFFEELVQYEDLCPVASYLDFCISELGCTANVQQWEALQEVLQTCGWIIAIKDRCIVCDRPLQFNFDQDYRFHAEGKPAIQYADGFKFYAYHGVGLPEHYGICTPREWKAQWLTTERNAEVRRVLIQEIGYDRICQELQSTVIDSWREYSLVQCATAFGYEPFVFLKMTCPSTQYVHVIPVPPTMESARAAIRWVNWGIDPEEFETES